MKLLFCYQWNSKKTAEKFQFFTIVRSSFNEMQKGELKQFQFLQWWKSGSCTDEVTTSFYWETPIIFLATKQKTSEHKPYCHQRWRKRWNSGCRWSWKQQHIEGACPLEADWWLCTPSSSTMSTNPTLVHSLEQIWPSP